MDGVSKAELLNLTAQIATTYVEHNQVEADAVPALVQAVYRALATAGPVVSAPSITSQRQQPAVPIRRSVFPDHIVCLEDGKRTTMLKRYLLSHYNMTPDDYRRKWGLPSDYPMVAPNYSKHRSKMAKSNGLGRKWK